MVPWLPIFLTLRKVVSVAAPDYTQGILQWTALATNITCNIWWASPLLWYAQFQWSNQIPPNVISRLPNNFHSQIFCDTKARCSQNVLCKLNVIILKAPSQSLFNTITDFSGSFKRIFRAALVIMAAIICPREQLN